MIHLDYHLHSTFSFDGKQTPEELAQRALALGLTHIALTDHVECGAIPYYPEQCTIKDTAAYRQAVEELREKYPGLHIRLGVELGWRDREFDKGLAVVKDIQPEFVIGSVHDVHGIDPYFPQYFAGKTRQEAYGQYLDTILEALPQLLPHCHVLGHIDYVAKPSPYTNPTLRYSEVPDKLDSILRTVLKAGKLIELNTSTCRRGEAVNRPNLELLKRYRELGGRYVTVGSDAHETADIAAFHTIAQGILEEAGIEAIAL